MIIIIIYNYYNSNHLHCAIYSSNSVFVLDAQVNIACVISVVSCNYLKILQYFSLYSTTCMHKVVIAISRLQAKHFGH